MQVKEHLVKRGVCVICCEKPKHDDFICEACQEHYSLDLIHEAVLCCELGEMRLCLQCGEKEAMDGNGLCLDCSTDRLYDCYPSPNKDKCGNPATEVDGVPKS